MRILVTGSRDMQKSEIVGIALLRAVQVAVESGDRYFTIVHGDCPTGADKFASDWVKHIGPELLATGEVRVMEEKHPADWEIGKAAGPIRNKKMVALGADLVLAFPKGDSRGTRGCIRAAKNSGLSVLSRECGPNE